MPNLILIGFMGTGKTTVGKKAARRLKLKFIDTDQEIERITGMAISDIFKKHGEVRFRSEEKAAVRRAALLDGQVISTGGGVIADPENVRVLKENGLIICLTAAPEVIYQRVKRKKDRPLLNTDDPQQTIKNLLAQREPLYQCAEHFIDTSLQELDDVVNEVVSKFKEKYKIDDGKEHVNSKSESW